MTNKNILLNVDSYKCAMDVQYPPHTTGVFSYIEARKPADETVFFGLQAFIKEYLSKPITRAQIDEAEGIWLAHGLPFNRENWDYIVSTYGGYLPVIIKAIPEGTVVPTGNALVTIENTDSNCFWLTTWLETALLRAVWYPSTVATVSRKIKKKIAQALEKTGDLAGLEFKLHDFGARGCSSEETATLGGMAHLVNFKGTDTISAVVGARRYYNEPMAGFSIPAAEHSTITSWGRDGEVDAYRNMLKQFAKPGSLVAIVSDSYNIYDAVTKIWGTKLRQEVIDSGATVVIRPDSGHPASVVLEVAHRLEEKFGSTRNAKGYRVLNNVRIIQGDGINLESIEEILNTLIAAGFSADNVAFGMGGALLQAPQRDDFQFAMKASAVNVNRTWRPIRKDPATDSRKLSKKGLLVLVSVSTPEGEEYHTMTEEMASLCAATNELKTVYYCGDLAEDQNFADIRGRAKL